MPLRRIVRRETQNGRPFVVLVCSHVAPGKPASKTSRYYPCPVCYEQVDRHRREMTGASGGDLVGPRDAGI
jgi:hypothetical protein